MALEDFNKYQAECRAARERSSNARPAALSTNTIAKRSELNRLKYGSGRPPLQWSAPPARCQEPATQQPALQLRPEQRPSVNRYSKSTPPASIQPLLRPLFRRPEYSPPPHRRLRSVPSPPMASPMYQSTGTQTDAPAQPEPATVSNPRYSIVRHDSSGEQELFLPDDWANATSLCVACGTKIQPGSSQVTGKKRTHEAVSGPPALAPGTSGTRRSPSKKPRTDHSNTFNHEGDVPERGPLWQCAAGESWTIVPGELRGRDGLSKP